MIDSFELRTGLLQVCAVPQSSNGQKGFGGPPVHFRAAHIWHPDVELRRKVKTFGHHADDGCGSLVNKNGCANHIRAPSKLALPKAVIEDYDRCCSRRFIR